MENYPFGLPVWLYYCIIQGRRSMAANPSPPPLVIDPSSLTGSNQRMLSVSLILSEHKITINAIIMRCASANPEYW